MFDALNSLIKNTCINYSSGAEKKNKHTKILTFLGLLFMSLSWCACCPLFPVFFSSQYSFLSTAYRTVNMCKFVSCFGLRLVILLLPLLWLTADGGQVLTVWFLSPTLSRVEHALEFMLTSKQQGGRGVTNHTTKYRCCIAMQQFVAVQMLNSVEENKRCWLRSNWTAYSYPNFLWKCILKA